MMFSDNQKISMRQTFRLFVFDFIGISTLLVPTFLAKMNGVHGIGCIVVGGILSGIYLCYLGMVLKGMQTDLFSYMQSGSFRGPARLLYAYLALSCVLTASYVAHTFTNLMRHSLIREESYWLILILMLLVAGYVVKGGIESRARIYEVLFWLLLIPLFVMLFFSVKGIDVGNWEPLREFSAGDFAKGCYLVFLFFASSFFVLLFPSCMQKKEEAGKLLRCVGCALGCSVGLLLVLNLILLGTFGENSLAKMEFPSVTLMSTVKITGNFVKRLDALMLGVWFFTLYALLNMNLHYGVKFMEMAVGKTGNKRYIGILLVLIFLFCLLLHENEAYQALLEKYFWYVGAPMYVVIPGVVLLCGRGQAGKPVGMFVALFGVLAGSGIFLTGCGNRELENKSFPMMALIGYEENEPQVRVSGPAGIRAKKDTEGNLVGFAYVFPLSGKKSEDAEKDSGTDVPMVYEGTFQEALETYEKRLNRQADYNHLKVILMEKDFIEDETAYEGMLDWCQELESYPRNTYVCVTEDIGALLDVRERLTEDLGTYVEQLLENHEYGHEAKLPTLGDLIDEKENRRKNWGIPVLGVEDKTVIWEGWYHIGELVPDIDGNDR